MFFFFLSTFSLPYVVFYFCSRGPPPPSASMAGKPPADDGDQGNVMIWKAKVTALEEQLIENARKFAGQLSQVKLKLMEAEMGGGDSDDSDGGSGSD